MRIIEPLTFPFAILASPFHPLQKGRKERKKKGRKEGRMEGRWGEGRWGEGRRGEKEKERKKGGFRFISLSFRREDRSVGRAWRCLEDERPQNSLEGWSAGGG